MRYNGALSLETDTVRLVLTVCFALFCLSSLGQIPPRVIDDLLNMASTPNAVGMVGLTPTNVAGCIGYWVMDDYYTNANHPTLDSRVAGYGPFTNSSANVSSIRDGPLMNGHKTGLWSFSIPTSMKSTNSFPAGTKAIWAVFAITNVAATMDFVSDHNATLKVSPCRNSGGVPTTRMIDGSTVFFEATVTNQWIDEMYILDGASAATYTNGVLAASGNTGTLNAWTSIYMGSWEGILAEFAFFTNHVSSGDITSLHTGAANKYQY